MKKIKYAVLLMLFGLLLQQCQKNPTDNPAEQSPEPPDLLQLQKVNTQMPAAMDSLSGKDAHTRQGGVYAAIVRDIVFTNPFIGIPLVSTLTAPRLHPAPGIWEWRKQIFLATHTLRAEWDGDGFDWTYTWNGGVYQNFMALEGHTDTPGLNGHYTLYYNDADHNKYGTKTWSLDGNQMLTVEWVRSAYAPLQVPLRRYLAHFRPDGSGDLSFWESGVLRFHIQWTGNGSGSWELWPAGGGYLIGNF